MNIQKYELKWYVKFVLTNKEAGPGYKRYNSDYDLIYSIASSQFTFYYLP